jgi:hypothetical protein
MAGLKVVRIIRVGKSKTRVGTSDGGQLVLDHTKGHPWVGMDLGIREFVALGGEVRSLCADDVFPGYYIADRSIF